MAGSGRQMHDKDIVMYYGSDYETHQYCFYCGGKMLEHTKRIGFDRTTGKPQDVPVKSCSRTY